MPDFYYRSDKHESLSGFYYRSDAYAGVSIVSIDGIVQPGGTITVTTTGLPVITTATLGIRALQVVASADNVHEIAIANFIYLRPGDSYLLAVSDGVDSASQSVVLQNRAGWESVNVDYAGSPPDPATTSSFREMLLNYYGFTLLDGHQIQWATLANFSVRPNSTPLFEDITEASGTFAVFDTTNQQYVDLNTGAGVLHSWPFYIQDSDPTPDAFDFDDVTDADLSTLYTSDPVVLADFNEQLAVTITGGEYSINGGAFTSAAGVYDLGDSVVVRGTSSANYSTPVNVVLTVGGILGTYTITTAAAPADTVPDAFDFANVADAEPSTANQTNTITVAGINAPSPITIVGGEYQINGGDWTNLAENVVVNDVVRARGTSSASFGGVVNVTVTIGGVSDAFSITTRAADTLANQFTFSDVTGATRSTEYSALVTITGIEASIPASVTGGEMSINGGARVTSGNVSNNDTVRVYATSSANYITAVNAILSVGSGGEVVSDTFTITTEASDGSPPVITLLGDNPMSLIVGTEYEEPGYTATDNIDGDITGSVQVSGTVDADTIGMYTLTYSVVDSAGNPGSAQRVVDVIAGFVGPAYTPLDARIYLQPGADDNKPLELLRNNTNLVIVTDVIDAYTRAWATVESAVCELLDSNSARVFGPFLMTLSRGDYIVTIPRSVDLSGDAYTLIVELDAENNAQGRWSIPVTVGERDE